LSEKTPQKPPGDNWRALVSKHASREFGSAFQGDALLEASVLNGPLVGTAQIAAFFAATSSGMYEALSFTAEVNAGPSTYLEWSGRAFGLDLGGTTIVTRDPAGLIKRVCLYHRPYTAVLRFAAELATRLADEVDPWLLAGSPDGAAPPAVRG